MPIEWQFNGNGGTRHIVCLQPSASGTQYAIWSYMDICGKVEQGQFFGRYLANGKKKPARHRAGRGLWTILKVRLFFSPLSFLLICSLPFL